MNRLSMSDRGYMPTDLRRLLDRVDGLLDDRRGDGSLTEREWLAIMARLHPDGFADGYRDGLTPPPGRRPEGAQPALV
ncbi:MAG: hypothetical protein M0R75_14805 [Dehalococcoidia bacterium]|nr:hypothetical protein [Dehalococcoidia bacterium]